MAARRGPGTRAETIHCEYCGEDYAVTYRRCPFCDGRPPAEDGEAAGTGRRFGRRLAGDSGQEGNTRGGGYGGAPSPLRIIGTVLSLALIVAAVCIVISIIKPLIDKGSVSLPDNPDKTTATQPTPTPAPTPGADDPTAAPNPDAAATPMVPGASITLPPIPTPAPTPTPVPAGTAIGFSLNKTDFTINDNYPDPVTLRATFVPAGATGALAWSSSNTEVATVDANGKVTRGNKSGTATITATLEGVGSQTCTVRCTFGGSAPSSSGSSGSGSGSSSASLSLNHTDFTFSSMEDASVPMRVKGTSSTPTWSIGNSSVATISGDGVVRPAGKGTTTITCTVDGQTLECIVRCSW